MNADARQMLFAAAAATSALLISAAAPAAACTLCDSPTAAAVRSELSDEHLRASLLAVTLPFVAMAGVVGAAMIWPIDRRRSDHDGPPR